jgi:copper chaperone
MATKTYTVKGMTCGHCVAAVKGEVENIAGVSDVAVELESGAVTVTSEQELSFDDVRAAVDEAGYELVS